MHDDVIASYSLGKGVIFYKGMEFEAEGITIGYLSSVVRPKPKRKRKKRVAKILKLSFSETTRKVRY